MCNIFIFKQSNKANWSNIRDQLNATLNDIFRRTSFGELKKDFEIEIREICKKRSGRQLKAYWALINKVKNWMNSHGNNYTKEQVSDYFKVTVGHVSEVEGITLPGSIANKSDCTKEQMEKLINEITKFGAEHDIEDCYIRDDELAELLKFYER